MVRSALFCYLLLWVAGGVVAQSGTDGITPEEAKQVNQVARRFSERFRQTKDIGPITAELFVRDFIERSLKTNDSMWLFLDPKFARSLPKRELRETYVLLTNWQYLSVLYTFSRHSSTSNNDVPLGESLPKEVFRVLRKNRTLRPLLDNPERDFSDEEEKEWVVDTRTELRSIKSTLDRGLPVLRREVIRSRAGRTQAWKETIDDFTSRFKYYKPWVTTCDDECYGYPKGTRIFIVNAEIFQLNMVKAGRNMRIVTAWFYYD